MKEGAEEHLKTCDDKKAIAAYKKKVAEEKEREKRKEKAVETQEDVMAFKTWEHNGRQVGSLLPLNIHFNLKLNLLMYISIEKKLVQRLVNCGC